MNLQTDRGDLRAALLSRERLAVAKQDAIDARFETRALWARLQRELGIRSPIEPAPRDSLT